MTCPHVGSGCNSPEGERLGFCLNKGYEVQYETGTKITCKDDGKIFIVTESTAEVTKYRGPGTSGECPTALLVDQFIVEGEPLPTVNRPNHSKNLMLLVKTVACLNPNVDLPQEVVANLVALARTVVGRAG